MPTFVPGKGRQLEMDQDLSTHPQTPSWTVKGLGWPSWAPGASELVPHPPTAGPAVDKGRSSDRTLPTAKNGQPVPLGTLLRTQTTRPEFHHRLRRRAGAGQRGLGRTSPWQDVGSRGAPSLPPCLSCEGVGGAPCGGLS